MPNDILQYMEELVELYREETIKNIGVSDFNLQECKLAKCILDQAGIPLFGAQNHYSLIGREIVPICGCCKPYLVEQLGAAANTKLSETEMKQLEAVADELNVKVLGRICSVLTSENMCSSYVFSLHPSSQPPGWLCSYV